MKLAILFLVAVAILVTAFGTTGPRGKRQPPPPPPGTDMIDPHKPDFNKITTRNEYYAAFPPTELGNGNITQRAGRVFATDTDKVSEDDVKEILRQIENEKQ